MNKKGFTLIEIIVCISMLVVIGVGSFIGIRMVNKKLTIKELKQITDKAVQAAQIYIETNKEAQTQLYTEQNAVKIPLKVLINEGLLSLKGTNLDNNKIKDEYVITALSTEPGTSTECTNIDSKASWDNDKVIYICTNLNNKGEVTGSNLATIDPTKYNNKTKVSNEPYYFKGMAPNNYVTIKNSNIICTNYKGKEYNYDDSKTTRRILYIDRNDDILITPGVTDKCYQDNEKIRYFEINYKEFYNTINTSESYIIAGAIDAAYSMNIYSWLGRCRAVSAANSECGLNYEDAIRLPSNCKITGGTGAKDNEFVVECNT